MGFIKLKPEILTHPHIPKPLHGLSPRTIMGRVWWDKERQRVYKSTGYHCIACGVHKLQAKGKQWLEAHEYWEINYQTGICTIKEIVPLCHYCHNFIHSGRLEIITGAEISVERAKEILEHGLAILAKNKLQCFPFTLNFAKELDCKTFGVKAYNIKMNQKLRWEDFKLVWNGKTYESHFENINEWARNYNE